ncbi:MAG: YdcF family protein [Acetobacteraceae bacterium]|nr:YdcF family protein [Acetobacteraceae bacterium]
MTPVIVIFGAAIRPDGRPSGTLQRRVAAARACAARLDEPVFIPTGGVGRFGASEAAVMRDMLIAAGVPENRILPETTGTDTLSSVRAVRRMLLALPELRPVFVASSRYHLPRCLLLLRVAGLDVQACAVPRQPSTTSFFRRCYWGLREIPALPYDGVLILWQRATGRL